MTTWGPPEFAALALALDEFDHAEVRSLCRRFVEHVHARPDPVPEQVGLIVLKSLQRKRHMALAQDVAEALLTHGADTVDLRHRYALALVDHDRTVAAEALLAQLPEQDRTTNTEVQGAVGRVLKQRYVTTGPAAGDRRRADLAAAIEAYAAAYRADPVRNYYHGINTSALLDRAVRDGVILEGYPDPAATAAGIAEDILAVVGNKPYPDVWELATAAEASHALRRTEDAVEWLARYVGSDADAFEYGSTLRQFEQVWGLDSLTEPGRRLIPVLRNRLLQAEGGTLSLSPREYTPESLRRLDDVEQTLESRSRSRSGSPHYERVFGWDRFQPVEWLRQALNTCRSVARIEDDAGDAFGTGFVLAGNEIRPDWPARVLLTNAHVIPDTVRVDEAVISFHGLAASGDGASAQVQPVGDVLWLSPKHELDACFLALPETLSPVVVPLPTARRFPTLRPETRVRAYVIGYPGGDPELQLSLHDSLVLDVGEVYAHYRSPTETGSSGSPVFDKRWRIIALHHGWADSVPGITGPAGSGSGSAANEGIRIDHLLDAVRAGSS